VRSRHRFVYPTFEETTARAIEACEAAAAALMGRKSCVFRERSDRKINNEHAWPNWVRALFPPGRTTLAHHHMV
jgi:hypothetical protein